MAQLWKCEEGGSEKVLFWVAFQPSLINVISLRQIRIEKLEGNCSSFILAPQIFQGVDNPFPSPSSANEPHKEIPQHTSQIPRYIKYLRKAIKHKGLEIIGIKQKKLVKKPYNKELENKPLS